MFQSSGHQLNPKKVALSCLGEFVNGCVLHFIAVAQEMLTFTKRMLCDVFQITVRMIFVDWKDLGLAFR
jgi:hypothetical protein